MSARGVRVGVNRCVRMKGWIVRRLWVFFALVSSVVGIGLNGAAQGGAGDVPERLRPASCPPFHLLDEDGRVINPIADPDVYLPYSPRRTCGACHDYNRITSGYHFQQGADVMSDDFGGAERPWDLSDGMVGKFSPVYMRLLAKKEFKHPRDIDMTPYEWVYQCGVCHPGGGIMERDRDGHRYDVRQRTDTELGELFDGDYYGTHWAESGVVEADCLVCHLPEGYYDYGIRVEQIRKLNYRYAATAAAGFAGIAGSVLDGDTPLVVYNARLFNTDGKVKLPIQRPTDRGCLHCHDDAFVKTRGVTFQDHFNREVHSHRGIQCTMCHPGDINHNFKKGFSHELTLRDDLDGTMHSCQDCHENGEFGAPEMRHRGLPAFHLDTISCEACHVPSLQIVPAGAVDAATGDILDLPALSNVAKYGAVAQWLPVYDVGEDGQIQACNKILPVWWGHKEGDIIYPLFLKEVKLAYEQLKQSVRDSKPEELREQLTEEEIAAELDDTNDGRPEINTEEEIRDMIAALKTVETRFDNINPVYVKGNVVHQLDSSGQITTYAHSAAEPSHWAVHHDVSPLGETLGYNGCTDCHSSDSRFFFAAATVNPFGPDGQPVTVPVRELMGFSRAGLLLSAWREGTLKLAAPWIILGVAVIAMLHLALFGSRNGTKEAAPTVLRFRVHERITHLVLMLSVTFLAVTGFFFFLGNRDPLGPWAREAHSVIGFVAAAAVAVMFLSWVKNMAFNSGDIKWIRGLGGYLGEREGLPSGKYNAGQKIFFWTAVVLGIVLALTGILMYVYRGTRNPQLQLLYTLHDVASLLMLITLVGHIYLAILANPHSLRSLFGGKVSALWAKKHHPDWQVQADPSEGAEN